MTHDLLPMSLEALGARVTRVEVRAVEEGTFFADLVLTDASGLEHRLDCRPSDGIAVALRADALIRVSGDVLDAATPILVEEPRPETLALRAVAADDVAGRVELGEALARTEPQEFGKFTA
jgi:bifunctional DNase/RNase